MSCMCGLRSLALSQNSRRTSKKYARGPASAGTTRGTDREYEIQGTWDFKWPLGTTIRVAFQRPPEDTELGDEFSKICSLVERYAREWEPLPGGLNFEFLEPRFEPPLGPDLAVFDQHRSPFPAEMPHAVPYDVLVSVARLPTVRVDQFRPAGKETEKIIFPIAELGSYSRRADYGAPTVLIGPFQNGRSKSVKQFLESDIGKHVVVHEFGHVLGITHSHQSPKLIEPNYQKDRYTEKELDEARADFYLPISKVVEVMNRVLEIEVDQDIVKAHLLQVWPGNEDYSDWLRFPSDMAAQHESEGVLNSVMSFPYYPCITKIHKGCSSCSNDKHPAPKIITQPTEFDRSTLRLMYDRTFMTEQNVEQVAPLG